MMVRILALTAAALIAVAPLRAQTPAPQPPAPQAPVSQAPVPSAPAPQPPAAETPAAPAQPPAPSVAVAPSPAAAVDPNSLLSGGRGDTSNVDEVTLALKPAVMVAGSAKWDVAMETLDKVFEGLRAEAVKAGLKVAGRPLVRFVETTDDNFRYEALLPVDRNIPGQPNLTPEIRFTETPNGKALRFTHKAPYDDIDSTYEVLTAYLDAKNLTVQDVFVEEYVSDLKDAGSADFELNVYVQPK